MNMGFEHNTLPVIAACDAVIVGGSFGGITAALQLARAGYSVTLVEPRTYLGREITATLRPWLRRPSGSPLPSLIESSLQAAGRQHNDHEYALNMDALKVHLEDELIRAGARLLYASLVVGLQIQNRALQSVIIGNKSGRQVVLCRLLLDTSETALVAQRMGTQFEPAQSGTRRYRRTLEFDNVAPQQALDKPLAFEGKQLLLHQGYRENGHVLVECTLDLPFAFGSPFDITRRETRARHETMAVAAALAKQVPAFASAYLSGASYELCGRQAPLMRKRQTAPEWTHPLHQYQQFTIGDSVIAPTDFAGSAAGVWHLNETVPLERVEPERFYDPVFTASAGEMLGQYLRDHWTLVSAPEFEINFTLAETHQPRSSLQVREPYSPQRGKPYPRVPASPQTLPVLRDCRDHVRP